VPQLVIVRFSDIGHSRRIRFRTQMFIYSINTQQSKAGQTEDLNQGDRNKKEQAIKRLSALLNKLYGRGRARLRNFNNINSLHTGGKQKAMNNYKTKDTHSLMRRI